MTALIIPALIALLLLATAFPSRWTPCSDIGCSMEHIGGRNAGCSDECYCSVPVHVCPVCGDSDYGDNAEADETRANCEAFVIHFSEGRVARRGSVAE